MIRSARFWISITIFQVVFGLTVFALTRQYYVDDPGKVSASPATIRQAAPDWTEQNTENDLEQLISSFPGPAVLQDPIEISRQADKFFANKQYDRAAVLYEQLLLANPNNGKTYNNLGITLQYLGRSTEALRVLNEGIGVDPANQRIWLTLGYVNIQLGNIEQARTALATAVQMGADTGVGQSAEKMLNELGPG